MATNGTGQATINFGTTPTQNATLAVTGINDINASAKVECWLQGDSTADHNVDEHLMVPIVARAYNVTTGIGFTISAVCDWLLTGQFVVRYVWQN